MFPALDRHVKTSLMTHAMRHTTASCDSCTGSDMKFEDFTLRSNSNLGQIRTICSQKVHQMTCFLFLCYSQASSSHIHHTYSHLHWPHAAGTRLPWARHSKVQPPSRPAPLHSCPTLTVLQLAEDTLWQMMDPVSVCSP